MEVTFSQKAYVALLQESASLPFAGVSEAIEDGQRVFKVRISESTYNRLASMMVEGETFSDFMLRILSGR